MSERKEQARAMLREFKGDRYIFGLGCFDRLGELTAPLGKKAALVMDGLGEDWSTPLLERTKKSLDAAGVVLAGDVIAGAAPNAPREDVFRIAGAIAEQSPEVVVVAGGGSGIDAVKCAVAWMTLNDEYSDLDEYFGVGQVSDMLEKSGRTMPPVVAVQLASSSAAHLTKYSNITDISTGQKMLIVDEAVVPEAALFDYETTVTMPGGFTMDGGLDGVAHSLEVFFGVPEENLDRVRKVALPGIELIVQNLKQAIENPADLEAREALGLGTDLGGNAIMIGGTNGAHLNSFSLTDILSHGRACALMNPYYTVFFAPAIEDRVREIGQIYKAAGYTDANLDELQGRELGLAVAEAMVALSKDVGFPTSLEEVDGFKPEHIDRALTAAKNPKLEMKLKNMPVPLSAETVDTYMGSVLEAARVGDLSLVRNMD